MRKPNLDAIRSRAAAATPGPWHAGGRGCPLRTIRRWEVVISGKQPVVELPESDQGMRDAAFIAHARQDIPALLAEIDRLNEALTQLGNRANTARSATNA